MDIIKNNPYDYKEEDVNKTHAVIGWMTTKGLLDTLDHLVFELKGSIIKNNYDPDLKIEERLEQVITELKCYQNHDIPEEDLEIFIQDNPEELEQFDKDPGKYIQERYHNEHYPKTDRNPGE